MTDNCISLKVAGTSGNFTFELTVFAMGTYNITELSPRSYYPNGLVSSISVLLDSSSGGGSDFIVQLPYLHNYKCAGCAATSGNTGPFYSEELEIVFNYTTGTQAASCQGGGKRNIRYNDADCV